MAYIKTQPAYLQFLRMNPEWYRYLSRDTSNFEAFKKQAAYFHGKTVVQVIERISDTMQFANMLVQFTREMQD
ncbi:YlbE-like family protein [Virgibacillus sp. 179-BFC.A HS]|uniref:YlbE-like family protein n=1 Tax=Tigheibacillus jepli TaxID=3035914 RepID=A0ABU5CJF8_9BACI|nr:YlbE-like family protein [Virgibacillus sp. 179-BFC.A HS]MDY0405987.1 YlbE-like family protein [Virgibacillus sp. 179-BFC.A HS]